ncbi:MAG: amidase family protein [Rhizobiaceae bacterium]
MKSNRPETTFSGSELCTRSAREVVGLLRKGDISPAELIDASASRTQQVGGQVNAVVTTCHDRARGNISGLAALAALAALDADHPGYLAGLPIGIKDLTAVAGVRTTKGTLGFADFVPEESDPIADNLEKRGGLIVGKTNTPEMGAGGNTFNAVFGETRNPWDTRKNAGGSSGGAAVSLATGEVWLSHGSDLAGSLRTPAAYCGVVGMRASAGRVLSGPGPIGFTVEGVQGPMARSVADCALFLDAMSGFDARAPLSLPAPDEPFQKAVETVNCNVRIAYAPTLGGFAPVEAELETIMQAALAKLAAEGAQVDEDCPSMDGLNDTYITLRGLVWAATAGRLPQEIQQHYKQTLAENIEVGRNQTAEQVMDANLNRTVLYQRMRVFLERYDVLATAVVGIEQTPVGLEFPTGVDGQVMESYIDWLKFSYLATTAGLPAISVPCGFTKSGMPVGIQLIGPPRGDAKVLAIAHALEQVLDLGTSPIDPFVKH